MQQCFCIKGVPGFDFYVKVLDTQTIVFNDLSEWVTDEPYVIPETFQVDMVLPDSSVITLELNTSSSTVLRSSDIGISKFKDGIYCFKIDGQNEFSGGCGLDYTKVTGVFPNIECCIDTAYSKIDEDKFYEIQDVELWLKRAKDSASLGKESQSLSEWKVAKKLLQSINCQCDC
jgi:hypothetical protein